MTDLYNQKPISINILMSSKQKQPSIKSKPNLLPEESQSVLKTKSIQSVPKTLSEESVPKTLSEESVPKTLSEESPSVPKSIPTRKSQLPSKSLSKEESQTEESQTISQNEDLPIQEESLFTPCIEKSYKYSFEGIPLSMNVSKWSMIGYFGVMFVVNIFLLLLLNHKNPELLKYVRKSFTIIGAISVVPLLSLLFRHFDIVKYFGKNILLFWLLTPYKHRLVTIITLLNILIVIVLQKFHNELGINVKLSSPIFTTMVIMVIVLSFVGMGIYIFNTDDNITYKFADSLDIERMYYVLDFMKKNKNTIEKYRDIFVRMYKEDDEQIKDKIYIELNLLRNFITKNKFQIKKFRWYIKFIKRSYPNLIRIFPIDILSKFANIIGNYTNDEIYYLIMSKNKKIDPIISKFFHLEYDENCDEVEIEINRDEKINESYEMRNHKLWKDKSKEIILLLVFLVLLIIFIVYYIVLQLMKRSILQL